MNLIIDASLSEPPSEVSVFRDVTLYSNLFLNCSILLECDNDMKDLYYYWLKNRGAFDFVDDFVKFEEEKGITMRPHKANISIKHLRAEKLSWVISRLKTIL